MRTYETQAQTRQQQATAVARATMAVAEIGPWLGRVYSHAAACAQRQGVTIAGPPFARYHLLDPGHFSVEAGFPVSRPVNAEGEIEPSSLPGGPIATTVHFGPYDQMNPAYEALTRWIEDHGGQPVGDPWEVYYSDPETQPDPATWRTEVVQPYEAAG
jgi:effector-binding domain-containing protein